MLLAFAACVAVCVAVPARAMRASDKYVTTPRALGLAFEDVEFRSAADSVYLHGWWFAGPQGAPVVVVCPGGDGNMSNKLTSVREWQRLGFAVMTFDLRDTGPASAGAADSLERLVFASRWVNDTQGAFACARARAGGAPVVAWGQDLGGPLAISALARVRGGVDAIATEGLFRTSLEQIAWIGTSQDPEVEKAHRVRVYTADEPVSAAWRVRVPVFAVLAGKDDVTPVDRTQQVLAHVSGPRETWLVADGGHDQLERTPGYFEKLAAWYRRVLAVQARRTIVR